MKWFPGFGFQRRNRELKEEIDAHLQMAIADRVARGETAEAARQAATREFGNIPLVQDVTRQMWGGGWFEQIGRDVRYALRRHFHDMSIPRPTVGMSSARRSAH